MSLDALRAALADRYRIERELGQGGMATVYLAHDLRHDRQVALKVLRPDVASGLSAERFAREIRLAARLNHPHILPLFDSGDAEGHLYFVMPMVEGESLRDRLRKTRQLGIEEVIQLATEIAGALDYAHRHEVLHRDIKPENILLHDGHAVVADFGVGKAIAASNDTTLTSAGLAVGTPAYMSPEQAVGEDSIDGRSDLYSLGCVLFELLTGEQPFTGATAQAVIAKRFVATPAPVTTTRANVPVALAEAIRRLLARVPADRYPTGAALIEALKHSTDSTPVATIPGPEEHAIAVLPFANMSADPEAEYFSDGMTEEILNALARLGGLRVMARTSSFAFKGRNVDVREIGTALGVRYLLEGSVRKAGNRLRITAQLIDAGTGHHLWSDRYDRDMHDVFAVQDEITAAIRDELATRLLGIGEAMAVIEQPIDPETYEMFLRGRHLIVSSVQGIPKGMDLLQEVIRRAPAYVPAYCDLAGAYAAMTYYCYLPAHEGWPAVRKAAEAALRINPREARAHGHLATIALFHDWDWPAARRHLDEALGLEPNDPRILATLAFYYSSGGNHAAAIKVIRRAAQIDPLNVGGTLVNLAIHEYFSGNLHGALEVTQRMIDLAPGYSEGHRWRGLVFANLGRLDEALESTSRAVGISARHQWSLSNHAMFLALAGRLEEARAVYRELLELGRSQNVLHLALACEAYLDGALDVDVAFARYEKMVDAREFWAPMFRVDPYFLQLRDDPRFEPMARRIGVPTSVPD